MELIIPKFTVKVMETLNENDHVQMLENSYLTFIVYNSGSCIKKVARSTHIAGKYWRDYLLFKIFLVPITNFATSTL